MPTPLVLDVQTDISNAKAGLKAVGDGISNIEKGAKKANAPLEGLAGGIDKVSKRTNDKLGAYLFRDMASSAMGAASSVGGANSALQGTQVALESAGRAAMLFSGNLGFLVIAGAAAFSIFKNIRDGAKESREQFEQNTGTLIQNKMALEDLVSSTSRYITLSSKEKSAILENSRALDDQIKKKALVALEEAKVAQATAERQKTALSNYEAAKKLNVQSKEYRDSLAALRKEGLTTINVDKQREEVTARLTDSTGKLAAANRLLNEMDKKYSDQKAVRSETDAKNLERTMTLESIRAQQQAQALSDSGNLAQAKAMEMQATMDLTVAEQMYQDALESGNSKAIRNSSIILAAKRDEVAAFKAASKEILATEQAKAAKIASLTSAASNLFIAQNGKVLLNARQVMADEIKSFANMMAAKAEMRAAESLANPALAAAYIAAAVAIRAIGSAAASAIVAGGQSASGAGAESASSSASSSSSTDTLAGQEQADTRPFNLTINVNALHSGTKEELGIQIVKLLNEAQDVAGAQLKATVVQGSGSWVVA